jgi:hypothetical protein
VTDRLPGTAEQVLQAIVDRHEILDVLHRYSRGVDRGDWELVASSYHADAFDDHGAYRGDVPGLVDWLRNRFRDVVDSTHFLGQSLVEMHGPDSAMVETYFVSRRLLPEGDETLSDPKHHCREVWGRYIDRFERRGGCWAVAARQVVVDARYLTPVRDGLRRDDGMTTWGMRDGTDPVQLAVRTAGATGRS